VPPDEPLTLLFSEHAVRRTSWPSAAAPTSLGMGSSDDRGQRSKTAPIPPRRGQAPAHEIRGPIGSCTVDYAESSPLARQPGPIVLLGDGAWL
jgi:hypothetical protein